MDYSSTMYMLDKVIRAFIDEDCTSNKVKIDSREMYVNVIA